MKLIHSISLSIVFGTLGGCYTMGGHAPDISPTDGMIARQAAVEACPMVRKESTRSLDGWHEYEANVLMPYEQVYIESLTSQSNGWVLGRVNYWAPQGTMEFDFRYNLHDRKASCNGGQPYPSLALGTYEIMNEIKLPRQVSYERLDQSPHFKAFPLEVVWDGGEEVAYGLIMKFRRSPEDYGVWLKIPRPKFKGSCVGTWEYTRNNHWDGSLLCDDGGSVTLTGEYSDKPSDEVEFEGNVHTAIIGSGRDGQGRFVRIRYPNVGFK